MQSNRKPPPAFDFGAPAPQAAKPAARAAAPALSGPLPDDDLRDLANAIMHDVRGARSVAGLASVFDRHAAGLGQMIRRRPDIAHTVVLDMAIKQNAIVVEQGG